MNQPVLKSVQLKNFKAIQNSGRMPIGPLTVYIGNNGSGKSSVLEGLRTMQLIVAEGLDEAVQIWRGLNHVRHHAAEEDRKIKNAVRFDKNDEPRRYQAQPITFILDTNQGPCEIQVNESPNGNELFLQYERIRLTNRQYEMHRDSRGTVRLRGPKPTPAENILDEPMPNSDQPSDPNRKHILLSTEIPHELGPLTYRRADGQSIVKDQPNLMKYISEWQFLMLNPQIMGDPKPQRRTGSQIKLATDGSNIAEYLLSIRNIDTEVFNGIIETLQHVLPYVRDLQPTLASELERQVYLQLTESNYKIPGWLLSTGTLRLLALLAVLRHPTPPPLIIIEEIENGLDPRTIHLIVEEIQNVVESGLTQVIITTHSPYLLDLLPLSSIVLAERVNDELIFTRPDDQDSLDVWAAQFSPGQLYTMNRLGSRG